MSEPKWVCPFNVKGYCDLPHRECFCGRPWIHDKKGGRPVTPDQEAFERLCDLRDRQSPPAPGMPRNPRYKNPYFRALAEAFEAGHLVPIKESVFESGEPSDE